MHKLVVPALAAAAVISAGAGAAAASAAGPAKSPTHPTHTERDRSGARDTSLRLDRSTDRTRDAQVDR